MSGPEIGKPYIPIPTHRNAHGFNVVCRNFEFAKRTRGGDAPDCSICLAKPNVAIGSSRYVNRDDAARKGKLGDGAIGWRQAPNPSPRKPEIAILADRDSLNTGSRR